MDGIGDGASMPTIKVTIPRIIPHILCVLSGSDLGHSAVLTWVILQDLFTKYGNVKFVEFKEGEKVACVRYETPEEATEAVKGEQESKSEICGVVPEVTLITGTLPPMVLHAT